MHRPTRTHVACHMHGESRFIGPNEVPNRPLRRRRADTPPCWHAAPAHRTLPCLASPANLAALLKLLNEGITVRLAAPYRGGVQPAYLCAICQCVHTTPTTDTPNIADTPTALGSSAHNPARCRFSTRIKACGCSRAPRSARAVANRSRWPPPSTRPLSAARSRGAAPGGWASWCGERVHASRSRPCGSALQPSPTVEASPGHAGRIAGPHVEHVEQALYLNSTIWRACRAALVAGANHHEPAFGVDDGQ